MAVFYHAVDRRAFVSQPQLTRWNHRYRGYRESPKINVESAQLLYDVRKLFEHTKGVRVKVLANIATALEGGVVVPTETTIGLDALINRVSRLTERVRMLEA
jgi:hypothetical protein